MDVSQLDERASIVAHAALIFSFSRPTQCRIARMWSARPGTCGASDRSIPGYLVVERVVTDIEGEAYTLSFLGSTDLGYAVGDVHLRATIQGQS